MTVLNAVSLLSTPVPSHSPPVYSLPTQSPPYEHYEYEYKSEYGTNVDTEVNTYARITTPLRNWNSRTFHGRFKTFPSNNTQLKRPSELTELKQCKELGSHQQFVDNCRIYTGKVTIQ